MYLNQVIHIDPEMLFITLLLKGLISMIGTTLNRYLIIIDGNKVILFYPIAFATVMFVVESFAEIDFSNFVY